MYLNTLLLLVLERDLKLCFFYKSIDGGTALRQGFLGKDFSGSDGQEQL